MAVHIKVTSDLKLPTELLTAADLREIGLLLRERIVSRTRSGVDAHGSAFRSYSESYGERKRAELGGGPVNLTVSGNMLNEIQILNADHNSVSLGWTGGGGGGAVGKQTFIQRSRATPSAEKAAFNNETREFFDVSEDDEARIVQVLDQILTERLSGA
jgi:hypothetical protein